MAEFLLERFTASVEARLEARFGVPVETMFEGSGDDDDGLPDTIIWCIGGDGEGTGASRAHRDAPDEIVWDVGEDLTIVDGDLSVAYDFY